MDLKFHPNKYDKIVQGLMKKKLIDVHDFGICKPNKRGKYIAYLVEEEDGSINWYLNPTRSDTILKWKKVSFVEDR